MRRALTLLFLALALATCQVEIRSPERRDMTCPPSPCDMKSSRAKR